MTALKPYPAYKDSGIAWIETVPQHWSERRLKSVATIRYGMGQPPRYTETGLPFLRATNVKRGKISRKDLVHISEEDLPTAKDVRLEPGEIIVVRSGAYTADSALVTDEYAGAVAGFDMVVASRDISPRYLAASLLSDYVLFDQLYLLRLRAAQPHINAEELGSVLLVIPPLDEQHAIAYFLDGMDARITRFIAARRKMIALLEEKKQAVINQAITRGLDPYVPMKDSGVDWLGEIPQHWNMMSLQRITQSKCDGPFGSGLKSSHYTDEGVRVVRLQNIGFAKFRDSDTAFIPTDYYATLGDHDVQGGDILIAGLGDSAHPCGRACVAPSDIEPAMVKADCFRFRVSPKSTNVQFLALQLSATADGVSAALSTGATRQRVNLQRMSGRSIALPPLGEQQSIVDQIDRETYRVDTLISRHRREIELMQEYRTRLISDVVTGKLDVRGVELPAVEEVIGEKIEAAMEEESDQLEEVVG